MKQNLFHRVGAGFLGLLLLGGLLSGCAQKQVAAVTTAAALNSENYTIGVPTGAAAEAAVAQDCSKAKVVYFDRDADAYLSVQQGKIDGFAYDRVTLEFAIANGLTGVKLLPDGIGETMEIAVGLSPKSQIPDLERKVNDFLDTLRGDGTLEDMYRRWVGEADSTMPNIPKAINPAMTIKVGTTGLVQPFSYYEGDQLNGYDIEMIYRFAAHMNAAVDIKVYDYGGIVAAAESGAIDCIMANLNATPERREAIGFSQIVYESTTMVLVRDEAAATAPVMEYTALSDLTDKPVAVLSGSAFSEKIDKVVTGVTYSYYNSIVDEMTALKSGRVEAVALDEPMARLAVSKSPGTAILDDPVTADHYGLALKKGSPLTAEINDALAQLRADGVMDALADKWFGADDAAKVLPVLDYPGELGTLRFIHDSTSEPMSYMGGDGKDLGYDVELVMLLAQHLDRKLEITSANFDALMPSIESGRADIAAGCISITPERKESVDLTDPYYDGSVVLVVRATDSGAGRTGFFEGLMDSFYKTFIYENRWKLIVNGLAVTVAISVLSGIFGSLLGFGVCMLRRSSFGPVRGVTAAVIRVIQGTPIVVFLMILYYVIFSGLNISALAVAVVGFSINFAVYVSEMMRTGIDAVDKGQIEAATALGYSRLQTFQKITFPQAARHFLPVFKGEFISMVKMTSVVGYIALQDLTKASDIIRSRTMEAFFPLIATAVLYFIIANLLILVLSRVELGLDPKRRKRALKGVVTS